MAHTDYECNNGCPVEVSLEVIGGKWKGAILYHLLIDTMRFNELRRVMPDITQRMLTKQLRELEEEKLVLREELEEEKLVLREVFAEVPPRVEYSMTDYGQTLSPVIEALHVWGRQHLGS